MVMNKLERHRIRNVKYKDHPNVYKKNDIRITHKQIKCKLTFRLKKSRKC